MFKQISFPGIGIDPVDLNPDLISIGNFSIKWYAIFIVTGILFAVWYVYFRSRKIGFLVDDMLDMALLIIFPAIVCARLYYVIFKKLENPALYTSFWSVIDIRSGGLAIYGALIGGAVMAILMVTVKKIRLAPFFDLMAPGVMAAQAIGRWGNFMNVEAYGSETTLPWRMGVIEGGRWIYVHPTFLYESLWNLLGFALVTLFYKKRKYDGQIVLFYLAWYGFGRMLIEGLRSDSLYIGSTGIRVSQLLGFLCFVGALAALIVCGIRIKEPRIASNLYRKDAKHYRAAEAAIVQYEKKVAAKKAAKEAKKAEKQKARQNVRR